MRIRTRLSFCVLVSLFLFTLTGPSADVSGQNGQPPPEGRNGLPLFETPWLGYDTGAFAEGFDPGGFGPVAVAAGDLDGDGDPDLLVGNWFSSRPGLSVLLNAGDGTYGFPAFYSLRDDRLQVEKSVADVALSDVDGDGDLDALATVPDFNGSSNILALWRNNGDGTFTTHVEFATGPGPKGIALADFNGDGSADVATANHGYVSRANNTVSVILHNGLKGAAAGFLPPVDFAVPDMEVERVAAADVNGDGRPDLALGGKNLTPEPGKFNVSGGRLAVLFNDGAGRFNLSATYISYPDSRLPSSAVALADLDKDGDADLIGGGMVSSGSIDKGLISVRRNAGNGTFGAPEAHLFVSGVSVPSSFALGDLNRDGFTDVVATTPSGRTMDGWVILLSNGAGGFLPTARYEASQQTVDAVLADANHDSFIDVVTVASSSAAVTVHSNSGVGTFAVLPRYPVGLQSNGLVGNVFAALEAGDLDRDGDIDVVTNDEKAYILKNNGKGTFAPAVAYTPPINAAEVKLRDLNGDGSLDLLFGPDRNAPPYHFGTALNNGDGTFAPGTITNVNACQAGSIDAFDLDGDGDLDVALTEDGSCAGGGGGGSIFIFRNDGRANFTWATTLLPGCLPSGIGGGDLNGDGRIDLVTRGCAGAKVFLGNGGLTFRALAESGTPFFKSQLADMNGDGRLDLAMILTNVPVFTTVVGISLGNGDGTFAPAVTQSGSSVGEQLRISNDIDVADADGDGDGDLFVTNNASNDLSLFVNNGDGSLRRHERFGVGYSPSYSAVADFDGDGAVDVASDIGLPQLGIKHAVVLLRNTRLDVLVGVPNAVITSPADGSVHDAPATIRVTAEVYPVPGRAITKVDFYLGDGKGGTQKLVHTDTTAPYGFDLTNQVAGTYSLYAYAYDTEDVGISPGVRYTVNSAPQYNISGRLTDKDGASVSPATVILSGSVTATVEVDATGGYTFSNLPAGGTYTVQPSKDQYSFEPPSRTFTNLLENQPADFTGAPLPPLVGLQYYPLARPIRILDTRAGQPACFKPGTPLASGSTFTQQITGACDGLTIPATARAVVGNLAVVNTTASAKPGYVTLYPSGGAKPLVANISYAPGQTLSSAFNVGLSPSGSLNVYAFSETHLIMDVTGYYAPPQQGGLYYHPLPRPVRLLDTRIGQAACDAPGSPLQARQVRAVMARRTCAGLIIPNDALALVGNVTAVNAPSPGYVTLYPSGVARPMVSNINFAAGQVLSNAVTVGLGADGVFNLYSYERTDFVIDVSGYFSASAAADSNGVAGLLYYPLATPVRLLDTRAGQPACFTPGAPLLANSTRTQSSTGSCQGQSVPATAQAVVGNVAVVNTTTAARSGYVTLYPTGGARPVVANISYAPGQTLTNAFTVGLGGGSFNVYAFSELHLTADLSGYYAPERAP
jgi:hypothetical protein